MKNIRRNVSKSLLFICLSLTLATIVFASARIDVPSRPGKPMFMDVWIDGCKFEFEAPMHDGGSRVINYLIECRDGAWGMGRWRLLGTSRVLQYTVQNMVEGTKADFRVKAVNEAGESAPSEVSDVVIFKDKW
ncbi:fibronectin type III domain-containing protein [uncultured Sanguibacteroides sp.]|uniref:fibronectin type III domain-containing protein n=1 Tax=uncultured Sanguibacteroides sp. TaxID=1635151 RepID=UPI0025D0100D|nr:fibronectin type III domain-containing protein [uncultured Sanguibacteroides sp.]